MAVDSCEMLSVDSLEPGTSTECRGQMLVSLASPSHALSLRRAPRFPWGRLSQSGPECWPVTQPGHQSLSNLSRKSSDRGAEAELSRGWLQERTIPASQTCPGSPSCQGPSLNWSSVL